MRLLVVRLAVVATALLCLGAASYAGQVWWAISVSDRFLALIESKKDGAFWGKVHWRRVANDWKATPWYGMFQGHLYLPGDEGGINLGIESCAWIPRRTYYEIMSALTEGPAPNNPAAWEAWFKAHPDLVWDEKQRRLVDAKTEVTP